MLLAFGIEILVGDSSDSVPVNCDPSDLSLIRCHSLFSDVVCTINAFGSTGNGHLTFLYVQDGLPSKNGDAKLDAFINPPVSIC